MKLIFLDVDGVLNHRDTKHCVSIGGDDAAHGFTGMSTECVQVLHGLVRKTGAQLVLSSTWRKAPGLNATSRVLLRRGFKLPAGERRVFIGETPQLNLARGHEIQAWLDANPAPAGEQHSFVILDDDDDMVHLLPRLVRTNPFDGGLTAEHAARAAAMLEVANA
jgi:hypothetical protein